MNIQIFGTKKNFDSKKAERYFKERGIKYQFIDMKEKGLSKGEFQSVCQAIGGYDKLILQVYGVKNAEVTLAALEKKLGVAFKDWDAETTEKVRETLEKMKKKNTEEMEKYRNEPDDDLPF